MSTFRSLLRRGLGLSVTLVAIGALLLFSGVALADQSEDLHCPDGWDMKDETGADDNDYVPEAGMLICVKAGSPSSNESGTGNTGIILTDGESTLQEYLFDAGIVDGSGQQGRDVSYWTTYESEPTPTPTEEETPSPTPTPTPAEEPDRSARLTVDKDAAGDESEEFLVGDMALTGGTGWYWDLVNEDFLINDPEVVIIVVSEELTAEQVAAGWELVDITCDEDATFEVDIEEATLMVTLSDKDDVTCTFFNVKSAEEPTPTPTPTPAETGGVLPGNPTPTPAGGVLPDTALPIVGTSLVGIGMALLMVGSLLTFFVARMRRAR